MKSLIVYCSDYKGNTEKVAKVFARKINADLINLKNSSDIKIDNYDLIGFGSGVYKESLSPKLLNLAKKLNLKGKKIFVFSTSGVGFKFYNRQLIKLLVSKGATCKGSFACKGSFIGRDFSNNKLFEVVGKFSESHPNDNDFRKAEKFIVSII